MHTLSNLFRNLVDFSPKFSFKIWKIFYEIVALRFRKNSNWKYMNYGYAKIDDHDILDFNILGENLYKHIFHTINSIGKEVLEIGCGRGGGSHLISTFGCKQITGIDFSKNAISFCNKTYKEKNLNFCVGNAENLEFKECSLDIIVNIESSHCYGNRAVFFEEVSRTLKVGGYFLYADFMSRANYHKRPTQLVDSGFKIIRELDISKNVLKSMDLSADSKINMINKTVPKTFHTAIKDFVGAPGSDIYNRIKSGDTIYFSFICQKQ